MTKANTPDSIRYDFDDIVVGSGLAGLLLADRLRKNGHKVALFEQKEVLGGQYRKIQTQNSLLPSDLGAFVKSEQLESLNNFLSESLDFELGFSDLTLQPKTYENAQFKDFVGFGGQSYKTVDYFADFNNSAWAEPNLPVGEWIEGLLSKSSPAGQSLHEVTSFEKLETQGFRVTVNGGKAYLCKKVFFTPSPTRLLNLISHSELPAKFVSRLAKSPAWTMASLHISYQPEASSASSEKQHLEVSDFDSKLVYFLMSPKSEFEPCLGRFFKGPEGELYSYWLTLISPEQSEDNEYLGNSIKNIKKTLKRIFPEVSEAIRSEKITISPEAYGEMDLKLKAPLELPEWEGFYLASHLLSSLRGPLAHVDIARRCLEISADAQSTTTDMPLQESPEASSSSEITL